MFESDRRFIDRSELCDVSLDLMSFALARVADPELKSKFILHRALVLFRHKRYAESLADAREALKIAGRVSVESLVRLADAAFKLQEYELSLTAYWKCYLMMYDNNASVQSYVYGMLSKLWKKGFATIETCRIDSELEVMLCLSSEDEERYRGLRRSLVIFGADCDKSHTESRNRVCVSGYEMPRNLSWVVPLILAGMSTPKSRDDIIALERIGINTVITLTEEEPLPTEWFAGTEVENHFWPVTNYYPPCIGHADKFIEMMVTSLESPLAGGTLVHCGGGKGRAVSLVAVYMLRFGLAVPRRPCVQCREKSALWCTEMECAFGTYPVMSPAEVMATLREMRPGSIETEKQERFIAEYSSTMFKRIATQKRVMGILEEESLVPGQLKVEGDQNMRPKLVILMGLPGSGESSFAQAVEKHSKSWLRLSQDDMGGRDAFERSLGPALKAM